MGGCACVIFVAAIIHEDNQFMSKCLTKTYVITEVIDSSVGCWVMNFLFFFSPIA